MSAEWDNLVQEAVLCVEACALTVSAGAWSFAAQHQHEIAAHWEQRRLESPKLYNGVVHLLRSFALEHNVFTATFLRTDFKSFLYWRAQGYPEAGVRDGFGSAVIRSAEGHVLLGRQTAGHINEGLAYPPGGFIEECDVRDGVIDIDAVTARELREETGLRADDLVRGQGYLLTTSGPHVSIAVEWHSVLPSDALKAHILDQVSRQPEPELGDVVIVGGRDDIGAHAMPGYTTVLLSSLFAA